MKEVNKKIEIFDIDSVAGKISDKLNKQKHAEANWERIRKMKHRIIGMGLYETILLIIL